MLRSVRGDEASLAQSLETLRLLENALSQRQILLIFYQSVVEGTGSVHHRGYKKSMSGKE